MLTSNVTGGDRCSCKGWNTAEWSTCLRVHWHLLWSCPLYILVGSGHWAAIVWNTEVYQGVESSWVYIPAIRCPLQLSDVHSSCKMNRCQFSGNAWHSGKFSRPRSILDFQDFYHFSKLKKKTSKKMGRVRVNSECVHHVRGILSLDL